MLIEFYVNGRLVDTYRCVSTPEQLKADQPCAEDVSALVAIKREILQRHGGPLLTVMRPDASK